MSKNLRDIASLPCIGSVLEIKRLSTISSPAFCVIEKFAFILSRVRLWKPGHDLGRIAADVIYSTKYNHHNFPIMIFLESCYSSNHDILPIMIFLQSWYFSIFYNSFLRTFRRTFWDFQSSATFITCLGTCSNFAFCAKSLFYESWWLDSNSN